MTDVSVENHGTIFLFHLNSEAAQKWADRYVAEPDLPNPTGQLVVESRYAFDLAVAMEEDGLSLE